MTTQTTTEDAIDLRDDELEIQHLDRAADRLTVDPTAANIPIRVASGVAMFGNQNGLARYLGVARTQPGRWLKLAETPTPSTLRRVVDLDYVWTRLTAEMGPEAASVWLRSVNAFLDGAVPLEWMKVHGPAEVIAAFDASEAGSYA